MKLIDTDRLLTDRMKSKYYHLPNGDTAVPIIDIENAPTVNAIPISDGATNGDMMMAMFPNAWKSDFIDIANHSTLYVDDKHELEVDVDWWNAPYNLPKQNLAFADKSGLEYADQPTLQSAT